jgi:hypothetical protein
MKRKFSLRQKERTLRLKSEDYNLNHHCCEILQSHEEEVFSIEFTKDGEI